MSDYSPEAAAKVARQIIALQSEIAEREEAIENLKAKEAEWFELGEHIVGDPDSGYQKVTVYQSKAYNEAYGKKAQPELWDKHAVATRSLTSAQAKAALSEAEYALFQKPSAKLSVKIEVVDD